MRVWSKADIEYHHIGIAVLLFCLSPHEEESFRTIALCLIHAVRITFKLAKTMGRLP
jgi:hypothetical protein